MKVTPSQSLVVELMVGLPQCEVETSGVGDQSNVASSLTDKLKVPLSPCFEKEVMIL